MVTGNNSGYLIRRNQQTPLEYSASHLSVLVDPDAVAWAVTEKKSALVTEVGREPVAERTWSDVLATAPFHEAIKSRSYQSVSLAVRGVPVVLVPKHLFDPTDARQLLRHTSTYEHDVITHEAVLSLNAVAVMAYPKSIQPLIDALPATSVWSNARLMIDAITARHRADEHAHIYADISDSFVDLFVVHGGKFKLANLFRVTHAEDVLYHISNCARQLGLDHASTVLHLSGQVHYGSEDFKLYRAYHPEVNIHFGFTMPRVDVALSDMRKQDFMSLLNQFQCVS